MHSTNQIINDLALWREYVDPEGLYSEEEFAELSADQKLKIMTDCGFDIDTSVAAATIGRKGGLKGGLSTSEAKQAAVRNNGQKGGRPRRTIRVRNVYTGQQSVLCVRHEKANVVGSAVHEMVGDVQVQGPGPDGACEACEAGLPDGTRAGVSLTMAQRCNIPETLAQRLRELVVGGDAPSRSRHLELLRNEVRRVLLGDRLRGPNRTLPGGMTTRQIVSILQQEGLL